jgi:hypothetical protein
VPNIKETLTEIADIGDQITALAARSKELRMSLMPYHTSLPKSNQSANTAQVVVGTRLYHIQPVKKLSDIGVDSKLIDVTVTFDEVFVATDSSS